MPFARYMRRSSEFSARVWNHKIHSSQKLVITAKVITPRKIFGHQRVRNATCLQSLSLTKAFSILCRILHRTLSQSTSFLRLRCPGIQGWISSTWRGSVNSCLISVRRNSSRSVSMPPMSSDSTLRNLIIQNISTW